MSCCFDIILNFDDISEIKTLVFSLSDDLMLIFNVVVTLTCVAFCWVLAVVGFKGFLHHRARMSPSRHTTHKVLFDDNGS